VYNGSFLPKFRDNLSIPSSKVKQFLDCLTFEDVLDRNKNWKLALIQEVQVRCSEKGETISSHVLQQNILPSFWYSHIMTDLLAN
jgi:hypothetical protein